MIKYSAKAGLQMLDYHWKRLNKANHRVLQGIESNLICVCYQTTLEEVEQDTLHHVPLQIKEYYALLHATGAFAKETRSKFKANHHWKRLNKAVHGKEQETRSKF
eukprot:148569_1